MNAEDLSDLRRHEAELRRRQQPGRQALWLPWSGAVAFAVTNHGDPHGRVSLSFPFNAPGYLIGAAPADHGIVFDVVRCPIANYFRGEETIDLCSASWCNFDYALGELTHEKLVRTKTLVRGDDRCDFRLD